MFVLTALGSFFNPISDPGEAGIINSSRSPLVVATLVLAAWRLLACCLDGGACLTVRVLILLAFTVQEIQYNNIRVAGLLVHAARAVGCANLALLNTIANMRIIALEVYHDI